MIWKILIGWCLASIPAAFALGRMLGSHRNPDDELVIDLTDTALEDWRAWEHELHV